MSLTISIRFLTGRAHLHPWQTHHSEGRVEWPPSHWRLLRAIVAVAGRGLTSLPYTDDVPPSTREPLVTISEMSKPKERGVPPEAKKKLSFSKSKQTLTLKGPLTDDETNAWKAANPGESFAAAIDQLRELEAAPEPVAMGDADDDAIPLSQLARLLEGLSATPTIWLPKTSGGHTRQYFPIHTAGMVKSTGSAVFDTFAAVRKNQPLLFHWTEANVDEQQQADLNLILGRMTYFGRAESWCRADIHTTVPEQIDGIIASGLKQTHWPCVCIEADGEPDGREYLDYLLERRLAPVEDIKPEAVELLPRTKTSDGKDRKTAAEIFKTILLSESKGKLLLRCLLRESGQDIKDGLERPIGTRWIHYAVPRAIYNVPRPAPAFRPSPSKSVNLVRYALNTSTIYRPVLPPITDTLLVADRFRSAVLALSREPSRNLSGHEINGSPDKNRRHAFWWPVDEDNDGFIDHVLVWSRREFYDYEINALRRLTRLRQRGGRPDLLVTPVFVGHESAYRGWHSGSIENNAADLTTFISATPYFCPVHLSHGRGKSGRRRSLKRQVIKDLVIQGVIDSEDEVIAVDEIVFDYSPAELSATLAAVTAHHLIEPVPPRQYFPAIEIPSEYPPFPEKKYTSDVRYREAFLKDPDAGYCFGTVAGLLVDEGRRFIRTLAFCRQRRRHKVRGNGRMFRVEFRDQRPPRPFAIGDQCHFGLGLFMPGQ